MTNEEAKVFLDNLKICINEHPVVADWLVEIADRKTENCSEKPNNCEHITEDGVTCAKYPACDDCLDNPLNKVKGSERLVKGSEQTEPTISKMEQVEPQTCSFSDCDNFKNPDYERCIECKRKQIKLKTEQTEREGER